MNALEIHSAEESHLINIKATPMENKMKQIRDISSS